MTTLPSSARRSPGFWSYETLKNHLDLIVFGSDLSECLQQGDVSYRLHVGPEIYVSPRSAEIDPRLQTRRILNSNEAVEIPPGQFAFLTTLERVKIPDHAVGLIGLRAKQVKFKGLVNVSGFHADPGFHGHLIFAVFNAGPASIHVGCGDPWFQLMLADLDDGEHSARKDEYKEGSPVIKSEMLGPIRGHFHTLEGLNSRLSKLERDHAVVRWGTALIVGAITTGVVALLVRLATQPTA